MYIDIRISELLSHDAFQIFANEERERGGGRKFPFCIIHIFVSKFHSNFSKLSFPYYREKKSPSYTHQPESAISKKKRRN